MPACFLSPNLKLCRGKTLKSDPEKEFACRTLKCQGSVEWIGRSPVHLRCPKISSLSWWPAAGVIFSLGLLRPDQTLRGGYSKKLDAGKIRAQRSLTCFVSRRAAGALPDYCYPGKLLVVIYLPIDSRGTLALGHVCGTQPVTYQVLIRLQEAGNGASDGKVKRAPRARTGPSLSSGVCSAAAGCTCWWVPRGVALPQQPQLPPRLQEPSTTGAARSLGAEMSSDPDHEYPVDGNH